MNRLMALLPLLAACPSPTEPTPEPTGTPTAPTPDPLPDPMEVDLRGRCSLEERVGGFILDRYDDYSVFQGQVADGVLPIQVLEETASDGDCVLLRRENPVCLPACGPGETCDFDGTCIPLPTAMDLGTIGVDGLEDQTVSVAPVQPGNTYFVPNLDHPALAPDEVVRMALHGDWEGHTLFGIGVDPLVLTDTDLVVRRGGALPISWEASDGFGVVGLEMTIDQHGNSPVAVHCTFDDDGEGEVPASLIDAMLDAGVSGFPNGRVIRQTRDKVESDVGCADLTVSSPVSPDVSVDGFTPCGGPDDCPGDLICDPVTFLCEEPS